MNSNAVSIFWTFTVCGLGGAALAMMTGASGLLGFVAVGIALYLLLGFCNGITSGSRPPARREGNRRRRNW